MTVPDDDSYKVEWKAESDTDVSCAYAYCGIRASAEYPGAVSGVTRAKKGDTGIVFLHQYGEKNVTLPQGFTSRTMDARYLAEYMGIASLGINWRLALTLLFALVSLFVCVPLCIYLSRRPTRKGKHGWAIWLTVCILSVAALETETAYWFFSDQPYVRLIWKAVVGICLFTLFYNVRRPQGKVYLLMMPTLLLAVLADVIVTEFFVPGVILFLLFHALLIIYFFSVRPMTRSHLLQWLFLSLPITILIIIHFVPELGSTAWAAAAYAPVLLLMGFAAAGQSKRQRFAAVLLILSDLLLGLYGTFMPDPLLHATYMFLYYMGIFILATDRQSDHILEDKKAQPA